MKSAPFEYFAPTSVEETLSLLDEHGFDAKLLAGGQSLVPTMNFRLAQPAVIIDLNRVSKLSYIRNGSADGLQIGAMIRQSELERNQLIAKHAALIKETMPHVAHPQIRNRGTVGGSLAHADPAAELPAVMVALNARFHLRSQDDDRWVDAREFFIDLYTPDLSPEEIMTEIVIPPLPPNSGWAFQEVARRHGDFALVGVAVHVTLDGEGVCQDASIVLLSAGNTPIQASQAAQALLGEKADAKRIKNAADVAAHKDIEPPSDMHASQAFRRQLAAVLTERALTQAFERAV